MSLGAQAWVAIALSLVGGVLMLYWIFCTIILLRGKDPGDLHRR